MSRSLKTLVYFVLALALLLGIYEWGKFQAKFEDSQRLMNDNFEFWQSLAVLDRAFLTNITSRPSTLVSGKYILEIHFPGEPLQINALTLSFSNGQFALKKPEQSGRPGMSETLEQSGNVVYWRDDGIFYEANAEWVGLIDGNRIWGKVYGWNPGSESIGDWQIYPKPEKAVP